MEKYEKCTNCIHRLRNYCRAYQYDLDVLDIRNCTRRKEREE